VQTLFFVVIAGVGLLVWGGDRLSSSHAAVEPSCLGLKGSLLVGLDGASLGDGDLVGDQASLIDLSVRPGSGDCTLHHAQPCRVVRRPAHGKGPRGHPLSLL